MFVEQIGPAACRSYLVGCESAKRAILVDPLLEDVPRVLESLEARGLTLDLVVDTHTHADHHSGGRAVAAQAHVPYAQHATSEAVGVDERLSDGQVLEVGNERVTVLHTPGHTPDSVSLLAGNDLLTGDFLFLAQDGAGRLDLPGGDPGAHWDSLAKLSALGDDVNVRPGHEYQNRPDAALGVERRRNPRFQNVTRDEYVAWQRAVAMPTPDWMLAVIAANLGTGDAHAAHHAAAAPSSAAADEADDACATGGACAAGPMDCVPQVSPAEAHRRRTEGNDPFLLDVREPWEFSAPTGLHAEGAVLVPLGELPHRLGDLPSDRERELHVICKTGGRSARAVAYLIENGWRRVFNVASGTQGWVRAGLPIEN